ncbi:MAG TPA: hypothetical protein VEL31_28360, partial [Ktedonobacteraceae bacterium]|nr:hypothetical protein [Ktedonobacteraceae bacterium]
AHLCLFYKLFPSFVYHTLLTTCLLTSRFASRGIFDAAVIATRGTKPRFQTASVLIKRCLPDGDYQQTKGKRSEQQVTTGKIMGFRKFDNVRYQGQDYFIKGRMATGYAILMDIAGNKVDLKPIPKFEKMKRVSARSSCMMIQRAIPTSLH